MSLTNRTSSVCSTQGMDTSDLGSSTADASQRSSISPNTATDGTNFAQTKTSTSARVSRRSNISLSKEKLLTNNEKLTISLPNKRIKLGSDNDLDKTIEEYDNKFFFNFIFLYFKKIF